jgi:hypothetical protein
MPDDLRKALTEISNSVQENQKKTFGRVLTQEELDASDAESQEERMKKYASMTPAEAAAALERETAQWEKDMTEAYGKEYLDFDFDEGD